jgi:hypothetical protein
VRRLAGFHERLKLPPVFRRRAVPTISLNMTESRGIIQLDATFMGSLKAVSRYWPSGIQDERSYTK